VHVFPLQNFGVGNVQIKIGSTRDTITFPVDFIATVEPTSVNDGEINPEKYQLLQNYPNPFNPSTKISFSLPERGFVNLTVYNSIGQKIKTLISRTLEAGRHTVNFNAEGLTAGIYFYKIETVGFVSTRKMILLK
jgi:hypothetical protein